MKAMVDQEQVVVINKKEVDDTLKKHIPELRGSRIYRISLSGQYVQIRCDNPYSDPIAKKDYYFETKRQDNTKNIDIQVEYKLFLSMLGIKEDIRFIYIKVQSEHDKYAFNDEVRWVADMVPDKYQFYFLEVGKQKEERIVSMEAI